MTDVPPRTPAPCRPPRPRGPAPVAGVQPADPLGRLLAAAVARCGPGPVRDWLEQLAAAPAAGSAPPARSPDTAAGGHPAAAATPGRGPAAGVVA